VSLYTKREREKTSSLPPDRVDPMLKEREVAVKLRALIGSISAPIKPIAVRRGSYIPNMAKYGEGRAERERDMMCNNVCVFRLWAGCPD
jgi:hypothetical protein